MLVLSRHVGEVIRIGDEIVISVERVSWEKVRLGIAAPIEIPVHRGEVYEAIRRERLERARRAAWGLGGAGGLKGGA